MAVLSACGGSTPAESPEEVIQKFQDATSDFQSGDFDISAKITGADSDESIDLELDLDLAFDNRNESERKADIEIEIDGTFDLAQQATAGNLEAAVRTIGQEFYFRVDDINVDDPSVAIFKGLAAPYLDKWLHISSEFIPEDIRNLQQKDPETLAQEEALRDLFKEANIFIVDKEYGVESVNGTKAYHYGVRFDPAGMKDYIQKVNAITSPELTDAEKAQIEKDLEESIAVINAISSFDLWIGTKDYHAYKASLVIEGGNFAGEGDQEVDMNVELTIEGDDFNEDQEISAPKDAEDFDPLSLLLGNSGALSQPTEDHTDIQ